jgi:hypothetical protein
MPKLNEVAGLAERVVELKDEVKLPWESTKNESILSTVLDEFPGAMKEGGSIIPLRDLYRATKASAAEKPAINPKGRGGNERVWEARRKGMGLTYLATATGLSAKELKAVLAAAPDGDQMLKRSYGLDADGKPKWSEGAAKIHAARKAEGEVTEPDEDDEEDDVTPEPVAEAPKPRRRRRKAA